MASREMLYFIKTVLFFEVLWLSNIFKLSEMYQSGTHCPRHHDEMIHVQYKSLPSTPVQVNSYEVCLQYSLPEPLLVAHGCQGNISLYLRSYLYLTQDFFKAVTKPLCVNKTDVLYESNNPTVTSAVFVADFLLMIIRSKVYTYNLLTSTLTASAGLPATVDQLSTFACCDPLPQWCTDLNKLVVAYNSTGNTQIVYLSRDAGMTFTSITFADTFVGPLYGITLLSSYQVITALARTNSHQAMFMGTTFGTSNTVAPTYLPFNVSQGSLGLIQLRTGFSSLLTWDTSKLFYSPNGGQSVLPIYLHSSSNSNSAVFLQSGETFRQVIASITGDFAAFTSLNRLFYGKESFRPQAVELQVPEEDLTSDSVVAFNFDNQLVILRPEFGVKANETVLFKTTRVALYEQLEQIEPAIPSCPFQNLETSLESQTSYIDVGKELVLQTSLIPHPWRQNYMFMSISVPHLVAIESYYLPDQVLAKGVLKRTLNMTVKERNLQTSQNVDYSSHHTGVASLRVSVAESSLRCERPAQTVTHIAVGCPPYKHIRLRNTQTDPCKYFVNFNYTILKEQYDPTHMRNRLGSTGLEDKTVEYDLVNLGCPISLYHMDYFYPVIDIYNGSTALEQLTSDFVMYEVHGRFGYGYRWTIDSAGCVTTPQTWQTMIQQQTVSDPATAWTKNNYRSCKTASNTSHGTAAISGSEEYEILNSQTDNGITLAGVSGILLFEAIVVDPTTSFCDLRTRFGVLVYGATSKSNIPSLLVSSICLLIGVSGIYTSFIVIKKVRVLRANQRKAMEYLEQLDLSKFQKAADQKEFEGTSSKQPLKSGNPQHKVPSG